MSEHIGTTTITALSRQGFVRAVAIEPDPAHLPLLRANAALNQLEERVTVVAAALSDASRLQQPFLQGSRKGADRWMKGRLAHEPSQTTVAVSTVTLNGLAEAGMIEPGDDRTALVRLRQMRGARAPVGLPEEIAAGDAPFHQQVRTP